MRLKNGVDTLKQEDQGSVDELTQLIPHELKLKDEVDFKKIILSREA